MLNIKKAKISLFILLVLCFLVAGFFAGQAYREHADLAKEKSEEAAIIKARLERWIDNDN
ncbi:MULTISPECIES: delta-aminolevulinic acid dehydratase [unclassified Photobacterium]|uniref:delta-aminolevulinic acid dehydratase n=1 Tax=unclassified Photobacterium TaxID=2628852 RepID=UPI000D160E38|nr:MULTISPECIES: delta-aminolevulinic acid dehydratase [unclassified Photobacterium]PSV26967.1 delta-aminolevulinic acid dehydratase [Photobacterium sp. GB-56]PSV30247.1 delta-aminolevulinic acid dehydratase [Photobacterium sp. GB-72]PSV34153.1 delta-aminolevulinic acid dehydratase [Photobacterium sp. GB-27]PSV54194.1 delta-aminolevulinic acid dehydratase [Photobacterium sp. GB-1]PSV56628.1 delta-aminolevulinic acid dehydratase [Photobacterium sp. GB-3]